MKKPKKKKKIESDYEWLARMKREGKPLGNYRLPSGFGMGGKL